MAVGGEISKLDSKGFYDQVTVTVKCPSRCSHCRSVEGRDLFRTRHSKQGRVATRQKIQGESIWRVEYRQKDSEEIGPAIRAAQTLVARLALLLTPISASDTVAVGKCPDRWLLPIAAPPSIVSGMSALLLQPGEMVAPERDHHGPTNHVEPRQCWVNPLVARSTSNNSPREEIV